VLKNLTVQDVILTISGLNRDGELLPVSIIKSCFSDLKDAAIEIYSGSGAIKYLTREDERRFFMAYNASRIHMSNYISSLEPGDSAEHVSHIYAMIIGARNDLSLCNNWLVRKCINKFFNANNEYAMQKREECYGDVYDSLLNAVRMFDYVRGNKFSTYAYIAINHALYKVPRDDKSLYVDGDGCYDTDTGNWVSLESQMVSEEVECSSERMNIIADIVHSGFNVPDLDISGIDKDILVLHIDPRNNFTNLEIGRMFNLCRETVRMRKVRGLKKVESYIERKMVKK